MSRESKGAALCLVPWSKVRCPLSDEKRYMRLTCCPILRNLLSAPTHALSMKCCGVCRSRRGRGSRWRKTGPSPRISVSNFIISALAGIVHNVRATKRCDLHPAPLSPVNEANLPAKAFNSKRTKHCFVALVVHCASRRLDYDKTSTAMSARVTSTESKGAALYLVP
jgi:hypothetical protein